MLKFYLKATTSKGRILSDLIIKGGGCLWNILSA
jgi:hypothetical protein